MLIKDILEFKLISTETYTLSVYHLLLSLIILIATRIVLGIVTRIFMRQEKRQIIDIGKSHAILKIVRYIIWIIAILLIFDTVGFKITFLLASSAALLVGIGLGLQQLFQDFISGITMLIEGTLLVGDIVETEGGIVGKVKEIGLRTSKLETRDNIILIVPNSQLINNRLINWSHMSKTTRFGIKIGVAYGSDVEKVKTVLNNCASSHKLVLKNPLPTTFFRDFGDSSLNFELMFSTNDTFKVEIIKSDLRFSIEKAFRENGISIPFPQRDLHIYK